MHFASDNTGPTHPNILRAVMEASEGYAMPYGRDPWAEEAKARIRDTFEAPEAEIYFVATGTAANSIALGTLAEPWSAICRRRRCSGQQAVLQHCRGSADHDPRPSPGLKGTTTADYENRQDFELDRWPELRQMVNDLVNLVNSEREVPKEFKHHLFTMASVASGCTHCQSHGAFTLNAMGVPTER
ncbi:MAG: beta-eliminating lyase-related protein, partial [Pseudomonadota bacterium]